MSDFPQPTFSAGELSPLMYGRTDLTKYGAGLRTCKNWIIRPHGCVMNRAGMPYVAVTKFAAATRSRLIPFVFSETSAYVMEFTAGFVRVYGTNLVVPEYATSYTEDDLDTLQFTQSADVLTLTCKRVPPFEIRRTNADPVSPVFATSTPSYDEGPFLTQNADITYQVSVSATSGTVTITANKAIFNANHVGALFRVEQEDISTIKPWEPTKIIKTAALSPVGEVRSNDGKTYICVAPVPGGGIVNTATGTIPPTHDVGIEMDGDGNKITGFADIVGVSWQYQDSGFGVARITAFTSSTQVTATVLRAFPSTVVGSSATVAGPWFFTGDGVSTAFSPLTGNNSAVSADYIVAFSTTGLVSSAAYTVTQPNGTITFLAPPAAGVSITIYQVGSAAKRSSLWSFGAWSADQGYPATCAYFQDRIFFAGTTGQPQGAWASRVGSYYDFGTSVPSQDDDALAFFLNARQINAITDLIAVEALLAATSSAVWRVTDGVDEVLTPTTLGFKPQNAIGSNPDVRSINVGDSAVYVQNDGRRIRDLLYAVEYDKFTGNELSLLAEHLFPVGTTVTRLDFAQYPFSLVYAVRSDGLLPTLSYLREQDVLGWSPWETQGEFEDVCSIPESGRSTTYAIVARTIGGVATRFIEKFAPREFTDITQAVFLDAAISLGGFVTSAVKTLTLTGGTTWDYGDTLTATIAALPEFVPGDVGDELHLNIDDVIVRVTITAYTSPQIVSVTPIELVPAAFRGVTADSWGHARRTFTVAHLIGETVGLLADGLELDPQVVSAAGTITLDAPAVTVIAGLPYESDLETLDVNVPGGPSVRGKRKIIPGVQLLVHQTRGLQIGPDFDNLIDVPSREYEALANPPDLQSGLVETMTIPATPDKSGRVCVRQSSPLPATIIGLIPDVDFGE